MDICERIFITKHQITHSKRNKKECYIFRSIEKFLISFFDLMMWYLKSQSDPRFIYVLPHREITIGRSVDVQFCNFAVPDDLSISRKHASLTVSNNNLLLQDLGSKYGTYVNNCSEKLESNMPQQINIEDTITFGKINCKWKVYFINFTTSTSTLKGENVQHLKEYLGKLGGTLLNEWDDTCAYLTMPAITLTIKVVLALVQGSHIVLTDFWKKCSEAVANFAVLPNPDDYVPQIIEPMLNKEMVSFLPNSNRKQLFEGKIFVFFSRRQLETFKNVLIKGSAAIQLLSESKMTKSMLCNNNIIVIQYNPSSVSQETQPQRNQIKDIISYLKSKGKRPVADAEIGLAILYCSLSKYCNPEFHFSIEVIKQISQENNELVNILAHESEELSGKRKEEQLVINETLHSKIDSNHDSPSINDVSKRKRSIEDENTDRLCKKVAVNVDKKSQSSKRLCDDIDGNHLKPSKQKTLESITEHKDYFEFTDTPLKSDVVKDVNKKLNLLKPIKRKQDVIKNDDDNLFNFVEDNPKPSKFPKHASFNDDKISLCKVNNSPRNVKNDDICMNDKFDISTLRGIKLEELKQSNLNMDDRRYIKVKNEDVSEIDGKLNDLDLGSIIVVLKTNLIIKRDPVQICTNSCEVKNFKKFKKVWPVRRQIV